VDVEYFKKIMQVDKQFEEKVYQQAFHYFISMQEMEFNPLEGVDEELVVDIAHSSHYIAIDAKEQVTFPHGAF